LSTIVKQGFLQNFVHSIRDSGRELQLVLKPDPASLNSLYVYEAKMSLLIRIAQTRQGADRLAESRLFYILSQCEFLGARPENDQDFLDYDTFLPSAIERYHQLLLPTLQLAASMLSTAGSASAFIVKQALDFVYAHRETIAILIADHSTQISVSVLHELQLLVCICSFVLPQVKDEDLSDSTSFKQIHVAILSLAARSLNRQRWNVSVSAANDTEQLEAQIAVRGYGRKGSVWSEKVETSATRLQKWVTVYLAGVMDRKQDGFRPVLSSNTPTKLLEGNSASHVDVRVPTVMDSVVALRVLVQELGTALEQVQDISSKLEHPGEVGVDEIEEIVTCSGIDFLEELDIPQRRVIAFSELGKSWERSKNSVLEKLHTVELLLYLNWRHLNFYVNEHGSYPTNTYISMGSSTRVLASSFRDQPDDMGPEPGERSRLQDRASAELIPLLDKLEDMETSVFANDKSSRLFVELLTRRLRDLLIVRNNMAASQSDRGRSGIFD